MLANRLSLRRLAVPQTSAELEQVFARCLAMLARVPLSSWQFFARLVLVLTLSLSLARLFWLLFPVPAIPSAIVAVPIASGPIDTNNSAVNIAQLKSLSVFGKVEAQKQAQPAVIESNAVNTSLNLVLMGVVESSDESAARAIISSGDSQDVYAVNAPLPVGNNVTLSKVMVDRVIINNNGQYESLWLYEKDPNAPPLSQPVPSPQPVPVASTNESYYGRDGRALYGADPSSAESGLADVSRNLADVLAMSIHRENGQVVGYKIRPGRDAEKFKSMGLQSGDVVTAINGMPLTNPAKIMEVYKNMGNATSASLEIKRSGSVITVDVNIQ